ncbi:peptide ABC transporter substrate-binding protein [Psychrobacillus vulpis]|uniref:Peptide ABC transporter substrate-binding protein n=1 Tax=Psychrobacillus vulpis TaxID=2325572 RepID=A0A544TPU5_9BACI|nr:peptide ABC transporter substrate-binding protein [Psychrobacillus vulpis]TQR19487.1 peptide ABC transporter substrate-binding protein [Psychrobacillus vulpis]
MKLKHFTLVLICVFLISACSNGESIKVHLEEAYRLALDSIIDLDPGLNGDMEFIAIDMSNFNDLSEEEKEDILSFFQTKYRVEVMDATLEELQDKGLYNTDSDTHALYGILLNLEKVDFQTNHTINFEGSKYRSKLGAVGVEITVQYKEGQWEITDSHITWIS